jgi:hypothetical protein
VAFQARSVACDWLCIACWVPIWFLLSTVAVSCMEKYSAVATAATAVPLLALASMYGCKGSGEWLVVSVVLAQEEKIGAAHTINKTYLDK